MIVLILGSAPSVLECRTWARAPFDRIVALNNAWAVRPDWDYLIHPEDFAPQHHPPTLEPGQRIVTAADYVPANNAHGGVIYAGGTMAFSAGYWALDVLRPRVLAYFGCDMIYKGTRTHFYGPGRADPLRPDPTLQDLAAKAARLELLAAGLGCAVVNLSLGESRLTFPRARGSGLGSVRPRRPCRRAVAAALSAEAETAAFAPSGRYWEGGRLDADALARIDGLWRAALDTCRSAEDGQAEVA